MERRLPRLFPPFKLHATLLALLALALAIAAVAPRARAQERRPVDETPQSRVFGRIVDSKGATVRGAKVELRAFELPWRPGEPHESFETSSDDSGKFELIVPTPTSDGTALFVWPRSYLDIVRRDFGSEGAEQLPRLIAGANDLGTFELQPTGAFAGRVTDEWDEPVCGAEVGLDGRFPGGMERRTRTNEHGEFELGHVPPGIYKVAAVADGFQCVKRAERAVSAGRTTTDLDFVLPDAKTISGTVVDELGLGVPNASLLAWPLGGGMSSVAWTDGEGRFVIYLKHNVPHRVEVTAAGFAKLDPLRDALDGYRVEGHGIAEAPRARDAYLSQGSAGVRLVLKRPVLTRFVVVDARTLEPVTRFSLRLEWKTIGGLVRRGGEPEYPCETRVDGEFECEADPRLQSYVIAAPGYGSARGEIIHSPAESRRCVVRLSRIGSLRGRVSMRGEPVEGAAVILRETTLEELLEEPVEDENDAYWIDGEGAIDPYRIDPTLRRSKSDSEGRFSFEELPPGGYRLEIKTKLGERRSIDPLWIAEDAPLDLGQVVLLPASTLEGRVITPAGTSPANLKLRVNAFDVTRTTTTDAEGRFRFPSLPTARAYVTIEDRHGVLVSFPPQRVMLTDGETNDVVLDASACAGATLSIIARIDERPAAGLQVYCESSSGDERHAWLDGTDQGGQSARWVAAMGEVDVEFLAPSRMLVARLPKAVVLTRDALARIDVDLAVGQLAFEWPALPPGEKLDQVEFDGRRSDRKEHVQPVWFCRSTANNSDIVRRSDQRCEFLWVQPGEAEWTVRVLSSSATDAHIQRYYRRTVTVVAGALAECRLKPEHRIESPKDE